MWIPFASKQAAVAECLSLRALSIVFTRQEVRTHPLSSVDHTVPVLCLCWDTVCSVISLGGVERFWCEVCVCTDRAIFSSLCYARLTSSRLFLQTGLKPSRYSGCVGGNEPMKLRLTCDVLATTERCLDESNLWCLDYVTHHKWKLIHSDMEQSSAAPIRTLFPFLFLVLIYPKGSTACLRSMLHVKILSVVQMVLRCVSVVSEDSDGISHLLCVGLTDDLWTAAATLMWFGEGSFSLRAHGSPQHYIIIQAHTLQLFYFSHQI